MSNIRPFFPAALFELAPGDQGHDIGALYRLDQLDGGQYWFRGRDEAELFSAIHGMTLIDADDMAQLRDVLSSSLERLRWPDIESWA